MFSLSPSVAAALNDHRAVVALESTVIAHGLPAPHNLETALACETAVREAGAVPATVGIIAGRPVIGLSREEIDRIAARDDVVKVNPANLAQTIAEKRWGATTVASSLHLARLAGIQVFATGGIGGVHRGASESFDVSADLTALARYPIVVVCAGAKAILDLPKTLEVLETMGVPVVGFETDEFPAFYSRSIGLKLDLRADTPNQVVALARTHWRMGFSTAVLVAVPAPVEDEAPANEISHAIDEALTAATEGGISGKAVTPFLLSRIAARTEGGALRANIALLRNNAMIAGKIAAAFENQE
jgi:pseudouridine-5'-phosphate glycosidase